MTHFFMSIIADKIFNTKQQDTGFAAELIVDADFSNNILLQPTPAAR